MILDDEKRDALKVEDKKIYRNQYSRLENSHYAASNKGGCNTTYIMKYSNIQKRIGIQIGYLEIKRQNQVAS